MYNLYIPLCSLILNIFLITLYLVKTSKIKKENNFYFAMVVDTFFITIFCILAVYLIYIKFPNQEIIKITNKLECAFIFNFFYNLFMYVLHACKIENKKLYKLYIILNILLITIIFLTPVSLEVTNDLNYMVSVGLSVDITTFCSGILLILTFIVAIKNRRILKERIIPIILLLIFIVFIIFIRSIKPEFICLEFLATFVTLIMYHTIENPDLKLIEEIKQSKEKTDELNADKSNFIFNITQEMKKGFVLMKLNIKESLDNDNINDIKSNLHKLQSIVDGSNKMINQTLNISEEDIIKIEKIDNKYNVKNLIKETTLAAKNKIKESIDFRVSVENNIPEYLFGDSIKIKQILTTIIENSIKYTEKGFIELRIDSVIKYEICRLIITLEDSGIGIDQKIINNIFNKKEDNDYISRNLNLNSVNKIINLIGGTFNINSKLNRGTKITITIDQHIPEEDTKNDQMSEYIKDLTIPKILLVDEDLNNLERIKKMFKNQNIFIDTVIMGEQCLRKVRNGEKFNLIIIDYEMPKLNGLQVFNKLKTEGYDIPVIITTDSDDVNIKKKYKEIGIYDVIKKPIKKKDIENIITYLKEN